VEPTSFAAALMSRAVTSSMRTRQWPSAHSSSFRIVTAPGRRPAPRVRHAQSRSRSASTRPAPADDAAVSHDHFGLPLLAFGPLLLGQGPWTHSLVVQSIVALVRHSAETCLQIGRQSVVFHLPLFSQVRILFAGKNRIRQQWHASNLKLLARRGEQPGWFTRTARCGMSSSCPHTMR